MVGDQAHTHLLSWPVISLPHGPWEASRTAGCLPLSTQPLSECFACGHPMERNNLLEFRA